MSTISPGLKRMFDVDSRHLRTMTKLSGRAPKRTIVHRVNVGLDEDLWTFITHLAHETECTISEVIREMLHDQRDLTFKKIPELQEMVRDLIDAAKSK